MTIFQLSRSWPQEERYSLTDQIRRASRSASTNIAEAWRKRRYPAHFTSKLSDADSETAETQAWLDYAHSCGYLSKKQFSELDQIYEGVSSIGNPPALPGRLPEFDGSGNTSFRASETRPEIQRPLDSCFRRNDDRENALLGLTDCDQAPLRGQQS